MVRRLTAAQAHDLITRGDVDIIDVRDPPEWSTGHLPGARLVPLDQLQTDPTAALTRDGVLFVCAAGTRSETAARIAAAHGLETIYSLMGGTRAWAKAGLPLVKPRLAA